MPDHSVAGIHQGLHHVGRPGHQLHAQAHDQQHRWAPFTGGTGATVLDLDLQTVCYYFHSYNLIQDGGLRPI